MKACDVYQRDLDEKLSSLPKQKYFRPDASPLDTKSYLQDILFYNVQSIIIKNQLGPSPRDQLVNDFEKIKKNLRLWKKS